MSCLIWGFFYSFVDFFNDLMKYNHGFFSPWFFLWDFLCLVSLRWGRFFCWMNWIVCWLSCRRIWFFFYSNFFLMGLKKKFYSMKEIFYMSFFIYRKHGWGTNVKVNMQIFFQRVERFHVTRRKIINEKKMNDAQTPCGKFIYIALQSFFSVFFIVVHERH